MWRLALIGWIWMAFNSLVGLRNRVQQAWSLIDVQLKRRHDLIPRLVETVAALRAHEASTQTAGSHAPRSAECHSTRHERPGFLRLCPGTAGVSRSVPQT